MAGIKLIDKMFSAVWFPYASIPAIERIQYTDRDHTPYNKRPGSCGSRLNLIVERRMDGDSVNILMDEMTTTRHYGDKPDRTQSRTISTNLPIDEAEKLALFILEQVAARKAKV